MHCPFCRHADSRVIDSRTAEDGTSIRRRRQCPNCGRRFTTLETSSLTVVKRSGATEPFSRDKVIAGVRKACQGRPVSDDDLALLAQQVEETVRASGAAQIEAHEIGLAIIGPLRRLDEVAYLRFASVYSAFSSLDDFEAAIRTLRAEHAERAAAGEVRDGEGQQSVDGAGPARPDGAADALQPGADAVQPDADAAQPDADRDATPTGAGAPQPGAGAGPATSATLAPAAAPEEAPAH